MVAGHRGFAVRGEREPGAAIPGVREQEGSRLVEDSASLQLACDLLPAQPVALGSCFGAIRPSSPPWLSSRTPNLA